MRTRTIITTVALGVCLGLSTVPAQALVSMNGLSANGLSANGLSANGLSANGLSNNGLTVNGWSNGVPLQPTSGERAASPGAPSDSLPWQSISQQGIGKR